MNVLTSVLYVWTVVLYQLFIC